MTLESMENTLFLDFILSLPGQPNQHPLTFVIDALDECGNSQTCPDVLKVLTNTAALALWLKIIITSRPEVNIKCFFTGLAGLSHSSYDLATNQKASDDLRTFAQTKFNLVALKWCLAMPWPTESDFHKVISHANGLFIFIKTLVLTLEKCVDPEETLKEALQGSAGTAQYCPLSKELIAKLTGVKPNLVETWVNALSSLLYQDKGANRAICV